MELPLAVHVAAVSAQSDRELVHAEVVVLQLVREYTPPHHGTTDQKTGLHGAQRLAK